jgi:hypothetical protein
MQRGDEKLNRIWDKKINSPFNMPFNFYGKIQKFQLKLWSNKVNIGKVIRRLK